MVEPSTSDVYPLDVASGSEVLPRCCPTHPDWGTLSQHLIDDFPTIAIGDIVREVARAKDAVDQVDLAGRDALRIGELVARHQLMMRAGLTRDAARLDPETHTRAVH